MDTISTKERSRLMARVRSTGNKSTELAFIYLATRLGMTGWRRRLRIMGKPDFVFPSSKVIVFIDGCFWHMCPTHCRVPATNRIYWITKLAANRRRDHLTTVRLRKQGWKVFRVWEHDLGGTGRVPGKLVKISNEVMKRMTRDGNR